MNNIDTPNRQDRRLRLLCYVSLFASLLGVLYGIGISGATTLPTDKIREAFEMYNLETTSESIALVIKLANNGLWITIFNLVEIVGLYMLLRSRQVGFHIYTAAQIGMAGLFVIIFGASNALTYVFWNTCWVIVYQRASRHLDAENF